MKNIIVGKKIKGQVSVVALKAPYFTKIDMFFFSTSQKGLTSRNHAYIILTPLNPSFI